MNPRQTFVAEPGEIAGETSSTLKAFGEHGAVGGVMAADGGDAEKVLGQFAKAGVDVDALAAQLQDEGAKYVLALESAE